MKWKQLKPKQTMQIKTKHIRNELLSELRAFSKLIGDMPTDAMVRHLRHNDGSVSDKEQGEVDDCCDKLDELAELAQEFIDDARPILKSIGEKLMDKKNLRREWYS